MSQVGSTMAFLGIILVFISVVALTPPELQESNEVSYDIRINPNHVEQVNDTNTIVTYDSLSETQKDIVLKTMGDKQDGLFNSYVARYTYEENETQPAKEVANADYIKKNGEYYPVFSQTKTQTISNAGAVQFTKSVKTFGTWFGVISILLGMIDVARTTDE